ncbi:MAG: glycoside hydrolase family 3 N-terminal domain-containing protein [Deltaproteobacteria bacterium]
MTLDTLRQAPFNLDDDAITWVQSTLASLTPDEKVGQLFVFASMGIDPDEAERLARLQPAGICRFFTDDAGYETAFMDQIRGDARLPLLISADLEGSRMSLSFGTEVPNPLALAAVDDLQASRQIARIMAEEAVAMGINWSFTPVLDINAAFRSSIVATRGFGNDIDRIERQALAQLDEFQASGLAATVKHWPGEGYDDRDQHLVTTANPLSVAHWEASFGRLYRAAIKAGAMSVMSAHIAFPAYMKARGFSGIEAYRPASINRTLNIDLLRGALGFNGLIVSDATPMAGLGSWGDYADTLPQVIENGCDIILFAPDPEAAVSAIRSAITDGRISAARLNEALTRILGLKAALGLHHGIAPARVITSAEKTALSRSITARAPVLEKDVQNLFPISPASHKKVLIVSGGIISPITGAMPFVLPDLMQQQGFEISVYTGEGAMPDPTNFDLLLYIFGEETLLTRGRIFLDWAKIGGNFHAAMQRHWHHVPTALLSFGYPYYLYDAPRMPTVVNAFCTMETMQEAVVDCMLGRAPWNTTSPVDAFCGLEDARF